MPFIKRPESLRDLSVFIMQIISLFNLFSFVAPDPEAPYTKIVYEFLCHLLRLLLLIPIVLIRSLPRVSVNYLSMVNPLSLKVQEVCKRVHLTILLDSWVFNSCIHFDELF